MGKASLRRRKRRQEYLSRLARENPEKFRYEWTKRLVSWSQEAYERSGRFVDDNGFPVPSVFELIEWVLAELRACGVEAIELEGADTREDIIDICCRAFARAWDYRLYRLSNAHLYDRYLTEGPYKRPH